MRGRSAHLRGQATLSGSLKTAGRPSNHHCHKESKASGIWNAFAAELSFWDVPGRPTRAKVTATSELELRSRQGGWRSDKTMGSAAWPSRRVAVAQFAGWGLAVETAAGIGVSCATGVVRSESPPHAAPASRAPIGKKPDIVRSALALHQLESDFSQSILSQFLRIQRQQTAIRINADISGARGGA
jgi:hypothetical protein